MNCDTYIHTNKQREMRCKDKYQVLCLGFKFSSLRCPLRDQTSERRYLGKEREPGVGKLGWHGNFHTGFDRNSFLFRSKSRTFLNFFEIAIDYQSTEGLIYLFDEHSQIFRLFEPSPDSLLLCRYSRSSSSGDIKIFRKLLIQILMNYLILESSAYIIIIIYQILSSGGTIYKSVY